MSPLAQTVRDCASILRRREGEVLAAFIDAGIVTRDEALEVLGELLFPQFSEAK